MMSLVVVAGAAMQMPIGRLSDGTADRRAVLAGASFGAALVGIAIFFIAPRSDVAIIALTAAYGALAYTLYSVAVAHANDHADPGNFVKVSGGLLLLYGFGTMIGPVVGATLMDWLSPDAIFLATALAHLGLAGYTLIRMRTRAAVPVDGRSAFKTMPSDRAATPEASRLDPRSEPQSDR